MRAKKANNRIKEKLSVFHSIPLILLIIYTALMVFMVLWAFMTAMKAQSDFRTNYVGLPKDWVFSNFVTAFKFTVPVYRDVNGATVSRGVAMPEQFLYSILYAGGGAILQAIVPCVVAYMTSKFDYTFSKIVNVFVVVAMVIPVVGQQPSELQLMRTLGLYDNIVGTWVQKCHFLGMYYLVFYAAFKSVPNDFSEAAYIDGASELRVMVSIMLPLVSTTIFTVGLIKFIEFWNDYQTPLLFIPSYPTIAHGIFRLSVSTDARNATIPVRLAGCFIMAIPMAVLFGIFRNRIIGNLSMGGVKG